MRWSEESEGACVVARLYPANGPEPRAEPRHDAVEAHHHSGGGASTPGSTYFLSDASRRWASEAASVDGFSFTT